jgi:hypothetical protein
MPSNPAAPSRSTAVEDYREQILDLIDTKGGGCPIVCLRQLGAEGLL